LEGCVQTGFSPDDKNSCNNIFGSNPTPDFDTINIGETICGTLSAQTSFDIDSFVFTTVGGRDLEFTLIPDNSFDAKFSLFKVADADPCDSTATIDNSLSNPGGSIVFTPSSSLVAGTYRINVSPLNGSADDLPCSSGPFAYELLITDLGSGQPSLEPSKSIAPSLSTQPSEAPSLFPSVQPSLSTQPSMEPSTSFAPTCTIEVNDITSPTQNLTNPVNGNEFVFTSLPDAIGDVTVSVSTQGDFLNNAGTDKFLAIEADGVTLGEAQGNEGNSGVSGACITAFTEDSFTIAKDDFNSYIAGDGSLTIQATASADVRIDFCRNLNASPPRADEVFIQLSYVSCTTV